MYLTTLEIEYCSKNLNSPSLYAFYYGPNGLKTKDSSEVEANESLYKEHMNIDSIEEECPETIARKEKVKKKKINLDFAINEIENKLYF